MSVSTGAVFPKQCGRSRNVETLDAHSGRQSQSPRRNWPHNKLWKPVRSQTRDAPRSVRIWKIRRWGRGMKTVIYETGRGGVWGYKPTSVSRQTDLLNTKWTISFTDTYNLSFLVFRLRLYTFISSGLNRSKKQLKKNIFSTPGLDYNPSLLVIGKPDQFSFFGDSELLSLEGSDSQQTGFPVTGKLRFEFRFDFQPGGTEAGLAATYSKCTVTIHVPASVASRQGKQGKHFLPLIEDIFRRGEKEIWMPGKNASSRATTSLARRVTTRTEVNTPLFPFQNMKRWYGIKRGFTEGSKGNAYRPSPTTTFCHVNKKEEKGNYETYLNTPDRDSNLDISIIASLVYCEISALDHAATEEGERDMKTAPKLSRIVSESFSWVNQRFFHTSSARGYVDEKRLYRAR
uniref:Uncharacterized protein n=1 Tax=Timema tahoe TaxID=61484 RepID=A0A7R9FH18_9NEOP|nr:unnamed protein product [Timema tahoe]